MAERHTSPTRLQTAECPRCARPGLFRVVEREGRRRMICSQCDVDLPAREGPVTHWRDLVDGPPSSPRPDEGSVGGPRRF
ncbi:hypothetical protein [Nocardioides flavescens]|uniref:Uncharacterized protein n=1 Tax=Nocardioides flavescens TaxID=2691959 RepID=A0A6L7F136_9ACTN|nr:hypothetical protein [Nocardioides flavescens]MXG90421.1 hypothetical protein [Nocardioides flavescens]